MPDDFVQRGKGLLVRRDFAEVVGVCRAGLARHPGALDGRLLLGTALLALKHYDEAVVEMEHAARQEPRNVLVHLLRGEALLRRGDTQAAIEALAEAHALDPKNKVAAKLYNEALERAHGRVTDETPTEEIASEISGRIALPALVRDPIEEPPAAASTPTATFAPAPASEASDTAATTELGSAYGRPRKRRWPWILAAGVGLAAIAGGGATFFVMRASRQAEEDRGRHTAAVRAAASQTYRGYRAALAIYDDLAHGGDAAASSAAELLRAAAVSELGAAPPPPSSGSLAGAGSGRNGQIAGVYRLLAGPEVSAALRAATLVAAAYPNDAEAAYLVGRAGLRTHDEGARAALERSVALAPTPLAYTALGEAEASAGKIDDALARFDAALALVPGHPSAVIARARTLAASGRLSDGEDPERNLARLASAGNDSDPEVAPGQAHLAALALAEVKLARGDARGARTILTAVAPTEPNDPRFGEALVSAFIATGDLDLAEHEAQKWQAALPASGEPHVWLARVALARDKADSARAELEQAGEARDGASGLVVLGEIELRAGRLDAATAALDKALALRSSDRDAQVLRARADLARGDAAAAEGRLGPLYEAGHDPVVGVVLGQSLLARDAGAKARAVLEDAVARLDGAGQRPHLAASASLTLAKLARSEGRWADAQKAVRRALAVDNHDVDARLLEAELRADVGDVLGARTALDTLAVAAHTDARVLLAAARTHALTGDAAGARPLLEEALRIGGAPKAETAEVAARLLLLEGKPDAAAAALAAGSGPESPATALLLVDALVAAGKVDEAESAAAELGRRAPGRPEESLAAGRVQLAQKDAAAVSSFTTALQRLEAGAASPQALSDARTWLGRAQEAAGRPDDALSSFREAVRLSPTGGSASVQLGRALVAKGDFAGGGRVLGQAVKLNPSLADAYLWLGHAAKGQKKNKEARQAWEAYLELSPNGPDAQTVRRMLAEP